MTLIALPKRLNAVQVNVLMDQSLQADKYLNFKVIDTSSGRRKLVGTSKKGLEPFRSFAYFTTCIEPAKQAIRTEYYLIQEVKNHETNK